MMTPTCCSYAAAATASMAAARHDPPIAEGRNIPVFIFFLATIIFIPQCDAQPTPPSKANFVQTNATTFSPSLSTVIVVLISALFFLSFFSVYIRQCAGEAFAIAAADQLPGVQSGLHPAPMGLKSEIFESFPSIAYAEAKTLKLGHGDLECAVCLSEFEDDESLRLLPGCCHVFHPDCISAWLASHITCPVCRSDLSAVSLEQPTVPSVASPLSDAADTPPDLVVVVIADRYPTEEEAIELARIGTERLEERSRRGRRPSKLPRSHSTGHSLAQSSEDVDRYTLRLPSHIRRELFAARKFHRSTSCISFPVGGDGSSRPGYRGGGAVGEGSSRGRWNWRQSMSDRWPSFLIRSLSTRMPAWKRGDGEGSVKKGDSEGSSKGKLRTPFDCLRSGGVTAGGVKADHSGDERGLPQ